MSGALAVGSSAAAGDEGPLKLLTSGRLPSPAWLLPQCLLHPVRRVDILC